MLNRRVSDPERRKSMNDAPFHQLTSFNDIFPLFKLLNEKICSSRYCPLTTYGLA